MPPSLLTTHPKTALIIYNLSYATLIQTDAKTIHASGPVHSHSLPFTPAKAAYTTWT